MCIIFVSFLLIVLKMTQPLTLLSAILCMSTIVAVSASYFGDVIQAQSSFPTRYREYFMHRHTTACTLKL